MPADPKLSAPVASASGHSSLTAERRQAGGMPTILARFVNGPLHGEQREIKRSDRYVVALSSVVLRSDDPSPTMPEPPKAIYVAHEDPRGHAPRYVPTTFVYQGEDAWAVFPEDVWTPISGPFTTRAEAIEALMDLRRASIQQFEIRWVHPSGWLYEPPRPPRVPEPFADHACPQCAAADARDGKQRPKDRPCDICAGRGFDYLGRDCRHCRPKGTT